MGKALIMIDKAKGPPTSHPQPAWDKFRLSDRFNIRYGRSNPGGSGSVPVIGSSGIFAWTSQPLITHPTIVIGRKGTAGKPWLIKSPSYPSDTTFYLEPREGANIDLDFLYYALSYSKPEASDDVIPSLQRHHLEALELPLPPPTECCVIVALLSKIQAAAETQRKIVATLKELKAATMAKLFREGLRGKKARQTEIGELPENWETLPLGRHCRIIAGGTPPRDNPAYWNGAIPWVKTGEINYHPIAETAEHITEHGLVNSSAKIIKKGAVLMAMYGQGVTRGRVATLEIDAATNQACAALIPDQKLDAGFLYAYCVFAYERIRELGHGANQKNLSADILKRMPIPVPTCLDEQREIAKFSKALDSKTRLAQARSKALEALFSSTLHLLMTGQVRLKQEQITR